jgi:hypothetical protein
MTTNNSFAKILAIFGLTSALAITTASAQNGPLITVDELGNGTFNGTVLHSGLKPDPFSGIVTLAYQLPFPGVPGDVLLFEPGPQTNVLSDIIRFDGQGFLYFFSERETTDVPPFDPADVAQFPSPIAALQQVSLLETGPEGNNGAFYTPGGGPGGDPTFNPSYQFISDVPEPGSGVLAILGGGLWVAMRVRRQNRRS